MFIRQGSRLLNLDKVLWMYIDTKSRELEFKLENNVNLKMSFGTDAELKNMVAKIENINGSD